MPLPFVVVAIIRIFAVSALAGATIGTHIAGSKSNAGMMYVETMHAIQLKNREERRKQKEAAEAEAEKKAELEKELDILCKLRHSILSWTMTLKDEDSITGSIYSQLNEISIRQLEICELLDISYDVYYARDLGAIRTSENIARLTATC